MIVERHVRPQELSSDNKKQQHKAVVQKAATVSPHPRCAVRIAGFNSRLFCFSFLPTQVESTYTHIPPQQFETLKKTLSRLRMAR